MTPTHYKEKPLRLFKVLFISQDPAGWWTCVTSLLGKQEDLHSFHIKYDTFTCKVFNR